MTFFYLTEDFIYIIACDLQPFTKQLSSLHDNLYTICIITY
jgi:hypothetical protein